MKPIAWSYTALTAYETCPRQFYRTRVKKDIVSEMGEEAKWGDMVHKKLEARLKDGTPLPPELQKYEQLVARIAAAPGETLTEHKLCINSKFEFVSWFDKQAWCRGIIDVLLIRGDRAYALDWKTGKRKAGSKQLKLFALLVFLHHPEIQSVKTGFVWLKEGASDHEPYTRGQGAELWQEFVGDLARYNAAFKQDMWIPRKSGLCRGWCPVTGCEFWVKSDYFFI